MQFEVCVDNLESLLIANRTTIDRLELCSSLALGGLTPSYGLIRQALHHSHVPVQVLIRPRAGDFIYSPSEIDMMIDDIKLCNDLKVQGIVIGALNASGQIDSKNCQKLVNAFTGDEITFHRAFDLATDPSDALERIIDLNCNRLLTSGQKPRASEGIKCLRNLVIQSNHRIAIMAGSGINRYNALNIALQTKVENIHFSAKKSALALGTSIGMGDNKEGSDHKSIADYEEINAIIALFKQPR